MILNNSFFFLIATGCEIIKVMETTNGDFKMMTRKHFERVAEILGTNDIDDNTVAEFINLFAEENPRFDRLRFFEAVRKHGETKWN